MVIRKAEKKDLNSIINLWIKQGKYHAQLDKLHARDPRSRSIITKYARSSLYSSHALLLVAEVDNKIIGFARAGLRKRSPIFRIKRYGHIDDVYIIPAYRRRRIADHLLKECFRWFCTRGVEYAELSVHAKNTVGRNAWKKYGFKEAMIHMRKKL